MKQLYLDALAKTEEAKWYPEYVDVTSRVAAVTDWNDKVQAPTEFLHELIYAGSNGVSRIVDALSFFRLDQRPDVEVFRPLLVELSQARNARIPTDAVAACREKFYRLARRNVHAIFNRVVAAFMPDRVSPVVTPADFKDAYEKLCKYELIPWTRLVKGDDEWFSLNEWVMKKFRERVPDGEAADVGHAADNHRRGIAVWGVHMLDLGDWKMFHGNVID